jgi:beta-glucosidase
MYSRASVQRGLNERYALTSTRMLTHHLRIVPGIRPLLLGVLALAAACSAPAVTAPATASAAPILPPGAPSLPQLGKSPVKDVIAALTRQEKVSLVMGTGMDIPNPAPEIAPPAGAESKSRVPGSAAQTYPVPRLGIPSIVLADGPAGLRINPKREGSPGATFYATAFPVASALASSWDLSLVEEVGKAMGSEVRGYGVDILLAPALNIQRVPLGGRNFEYYSEDPLLSGHTAAAMVRGVQSAGVGTSIKHFAANNEEWNRKVLNVLVDERALREIYLRGFEIAVEEGHPWTVMSSYNQINGTYTSEDPRLLTTILRKEWHFDGLVMTDWFGGHDAAAQMIAGNDVLMPGTERQRKELLQALEQGRLQEAVLDRNIANLLELILKTPSFLSPSVRAPVDLKQGAAVARSAAAKSMVLLKNDKARLPLAKGARIALFGNGSYEMVSSGTGSGDVNEAYTVSLAQGLASAGFAANGALREYYEKYLAAENAKQPPRRGMLAFLPVHLVKEPAIAPTLLTGSARDVDAAVITLRRSSGEFIDRPAEDFALKEAETALLRDVSRAFRAAGKPVIVVLNVGAPVETTSWRDQADSILVAWQPGQEAGNAVADVLAGTVNPSGKLSMTFPKNWNDSPAAQTYPGTVLVPGDTDAPPPMGGAKAAEVKYAEGIEVGYRSIGARKVAPAYPFGHGLSYTKFGYGALSVKPNAGAPGRWTVTLDVTNAGKVAGAEVVQLYITAPKSGLPRPALELRRFGKTRLLAPGESETLSFDVGPRELASFDPTVSAWVVAPGAYSLRAGASSGDIRVSAPLEVAQALPVR